MALSRKDSLFFTFHKYATMIVRTNEYSLSSSTILLHPSLTLDVYPSRCPNKHTFLIYLRNVTCVNISSLAQKHSKISRSIQTLIKSFAFP
jgi:hypothetical protein